MFICIRWSAKKKGAGVRTIWGEGEKKNQSREKEGIACVLVDYNAWMSITSSNRCPPSEKSTRWAHPTYMRIKKNKTHTHDATLACCTHTWVAKKTPPTTRFFSCMCTQHGWVIYFIFEIHTVNCFMRCYNAHLFSPHSYRVLYIEFVMFRIEYLNFDLNFKRVFRAYMRNLIGW